MIPFNKPYLSGNEMHYIYDAVNAGQISGNGRYTLKCQQFLQDRFGFGKVLLTTSCTDALEMAALLIDIQPGDEVIMPSYTFVSTANAFVLRGAHIVFADCREDHPGVDEAQLRALVSSRTKAIVVVHYAGVACDMDQVMALADEHGLLVIEDAAHAMDSYYTGKEGEKKPLGSIGHLAAFSFHETKNIISGEGGMLVINDPQFAKRAEIIWEKGTNRSAYFRGEVDKYRWLDLGSSFLPSDILAAFLYAQLENLDDIQKRRQALWQGYDSSFRGRLDRQGVRLPHVPAFASNNAHMYYLICQSQDERDRLIAYLKGEGIMAVFHYLPLHSSPYYQGKWKGLALPRAERYADCLLRLPFFYELSEREQDQVTQSVLAFFGET
jgi:dTDP-4-amino-4,6-dideoxygalactose transaminase